ncbi:MAG: FRG domain-containing protein [Ignavibacteria bacterium]
MHRYFREYGQVSSTLDFLEAVGLAKRFLSHGDYRGDDDLLWFRGQQDARWGLTPKIYRPEFTGADEAETRELFQSRAIQLISGRQPCCQWEWYFLMQHHGAPTRLLDWTENPLIALYFAIKDHPGNDDAVVWLLDPFWLNRQNRFLHRKGVSGPILHGWKEAGRYLFELEKTFEGSQVSVDFPAAIEAPHVAMRLYVQSSRFVVFGRRRNLADMFSIRDKAFGLGRILISRQRTQIIEDELWSLGINAATVFPDIDGLGEYVCDQWRYREASKRRGADGPAFGLSALPGS